MAYSGKDGQHCTVFEIAAGRVDTGADIGFLSQYPGEQEYLCPPLSCLEVKFTIALLCQSQRGLGIKETLGISLTF